MCDDNGTRKIEFYGSGAAVLLPVVFFLFFAIYLFVVRRAFDMTGLAMGGFVGLGLGAFFCKDWNIYWDGVVHGVASQLTGTVVMILMAAGIFSAMMKSGGVADGLVWLGSNTGITGSFFCAFTFLAAAVIATATGSSIGTIFTAVPVFFAAGVQLGAEPSMLAGAVLSGAIFGDNLAPVSDVTVISASTQRYRKRDGVAEIGGVVASRAQYALLAALLTLPLYLLAGGTAGGSSYVVPGAGMGHPGGLLMLTPVVLLIFVAVRTQNVFAATATGVVSGIAVGLFAGRIAPEAIFSVTDGNIGGFLYSGVQNMSGTVLLCLSLFGITGVFECSGAMRALTEWLIRKNMSSTPRGAELSMGLGAMLCSTAFASVTSAALILFGPIGDSIGGDSGIHPYRRSHIISAFANSIPVVMPFSAFVFIVMAATASQEGGASVSPFTLFYSTGYPWALFLVFMVSIFTGWGRRFEGENGAAVKKA